MAEPVDEGFIPTGQCLQVPRNVSISVPSPEAIREISIRWMDLLKLKRGITDASEIPFDYSVLYGIFFGFGGSAILACIPLAVTKDLPAWVIPTSIALAIGPIVMGCLTLYFSRILQRSRGKTLANVLADVEEIEQRFQSTQQTQPQPVQGRNFLDALDAALAASPDTEDHSDRTT